MSSGEVKMNVLRVVSNNGFLENLGDVASSIEARNIKTTRINNEGLSSAKGEGATTRIGIEDVVADLTGLNSTAEEIGVLANDGLSLISGGRGIHVGTGSETLPKVTIGARVSTDLVDGSRVSFLRFGDVGTMEGAESFSLGIDFLAGHGGF